MLKHQATLISSAPLTSVYPNMILFKPQISIFRPVTPTNEAQTKKTFRKFKKTNIWLQIKTFTSCFLGTCMQFSHGCVFFEVVSMN